MATEKERLLKNLKVMELVGAACPSHTIFNWAEVRDGDGRRVSTSGHILSIVARQCIEVLEGFPIPGDLNPTELPHVQF